jgi:hypothetical protein
VFDVRVRVDLDLNDDTISFTSEGLESRPSVMRGCGCRSDSGRPVAKRWRGFTLTPRSGPEVRRAGPYEDKSKSPAGW